MKSDIGDGAKVLYTKVFARSVLTPSFIRCWKCDDVIRDQLGELERIGAVQLHRSKPLDQEHPGVTLVFEKSQVELLVTAICDAVLKIERDTQRTVGNIKIDIQNGSLDKGSPNCWALNGSHLRKPSFFRICQTLTVPRLSRGGARDNKNCYFTVAATHQRN